MINQEVQKLLASQTLKCEADSVLSSWHHTKELLDGSDSDLAMEDAVEILALHAHLHRFHEEETIAGAATASKIGACVAEHGNALNRAAMLFFEGAELSSLSQRLELLAQAVDAVMTDDDLEALICEEWYLFHRIDDISLAAWNLSQRGETVADDVKRQLQSLEDAVIARPSLFLEIIDDVTMFAQSYRADLLRVDTDLWEITQKYYAAADPDAVHFAERSAI